MPRTEQIEVITDVRISPSGKLQKKTRTLTVLVDDEPATDDKPQPKPQNHANTRPC